MGIKTMSDNNENQHKCVDNAGGASETNSLCLIPFIHQVGGHVGVMRLSRDIICKPKASREHLFYEFAPEEIKCFMPDYYGVVDVIVKEKTKSKSNVYLVASSRDLPGPSSPRDFYAFEPRWTFDKNDLLRFEVSEELNSGCGFYCTAGSNYTANPWGIKCQTTLLHRLLDEKSDAHGFLLLENVIRGYERPCVLDVKVGTQQHGDDATEEKRLSQIRKCLGSTSSSLAVRLCGMQLYEAAKGNYRCLDKYDGRSMSDAQFAAQLNLFLGAAADHRDLCRFYLAKLKLLKKTLKRANGLRFYSSSLLFVYDACSGPTLSADLRMIDFEHSTFPGFLEDDPPYQDPDDGYLKGLATLIAHFRNISSSASGAALA